MPQVRAMTDLPPASHAVAHAEDQPCPCHGKTEAEGTGIPFSVTMTTSGLQLTIGATTLPAQSLSEGGITIR